MPATVTACPDCGESTSEDYGGAGLCWTCFDRRSAAKGASDPPKLAAVRSVPMQNKPATYAVTFTDTKPAKLILPPKPAVEDTTGLCAWLTAVCNLNPSHPITSGHHEGLRGAAGHIVLKRRNAPPIRFEPASRINTPARLIEDLSWQALPIDGAVHALKGEHCREFAHIVRMLCGATKAITDEDETTGLVLAFLAGSIEREGFTTYGGTGERYEAAVALQRDVDEQTGRPVGAARYLTDTNTGEIVARVADLTESFRRQLGSGLARGFVDGRMAGLGWTRAQLAGYGLPGRAGRKGPHARCDVYRGHLAAPTDEGSVNT